jgi:2-polyprenyl-6-methoxyphenol hydroxylase-like FAD-dependent oxidoreductase
MREAQTEVLVVGAGPVGLFTGLCLAEAGIEARVIDREERTAARSYACALHPQSLKALARLGIADALIAQGRKVEKIAFYEGKTRQAELSLAKGGGDYPFLLILPQASFERTLEEALTQRTGHAVNWRHRLNAFDLVGDSVQAEIEELEGTSTGYIVPHWETVVRRRAQVRAQYLLGADGHNSLVRQRLGVDLERAGERQFFAAYEFETDQAGYDEVRVVLDDQTTNVLWPLPGNKCRWTFQLIRSEVAEMPEKERRAFRVAESAVDEKIREYVEAVAQKRAPWFNLGVKEITWCTEVVFEPRMAREFGRNHTWLLGDAAHQAGPAGVHSMNAGFLEGQAMAGVLQKIIRERGSLSYLEGWQKEQQTRWRQLLGLTGGLKPRAQAPAWVKSRVPKLLSCLPGTGDALVSLAGELSLDLG